METWIVQARANNRENQTDLDVRDGERAAAVAAAGAAAVAAAGAAAVAAAGAAAVAAAAAAAVALNDDENDDDQDKQSNERQNINAGRSRAGSNVDSASSDDVNDACRDDDDFDESNVALEPMLVGSLDSKLRTHRPSLSSRSILEALSTLPIQTVASSSSSSPSSPPPLDESRDDTGDEARDVKTVEPTFKQTVETSTASRRRGRTTSVPLTAEKRDELQERILAHQLIVTMRDMTKHSTSNDFLSVFSACDVEGHGTLGLNELWIGISRLGFQTTKRIVHRSLVILNVVEVAKDVKQMVEEKEKRTTRIRYVDFIDRLKCYKSPPEKREMEKSILKKKQHEMSAKEASDDDDLDFFDTTRNVATRSSSISSSISSSTSSSLRKK